MLARLIQTAAACNQALSGREALSAPAARRQASADDDARPNLISRMVGMVHTSTPQSKPDQALDAVSGPFGLVADPRGGYARMESTQRRGFKAIKSSLRFADGSVGSGV